VALEEEGILWMLYSHCNRFWKNEENLIYQHLLFLLIIKTHTTT
jgi:hypothetical protein